MKENRRYSFHNLPGLTLDCLEEHDGNPLVVAELRDPLYVLMKRAPGDVGVGVDLDEARTAGRRRPPYATDKLHPQIADACISVEELLFDCTPIDCRDPHAG